MDLETEYQNAINQKDFSRAAAIWVLGRRRALTKALVQTGKTYHFFLSHASEDKDNVARPLYEALTQHGAKVWFDEREMHIGASIRRKIEQGLIESAYGIVILSNTYMNKFWTDEELNGLFSIGSSSGSKVILPIWHRVSKEDVLRYSLMLADIFALNTENGSFDSLARSLVDFIYYSFR